MGLLPKKKHSLTDWTAIAESRANGAFGRPRRVRGGLEMSGECLQCGEYVCPHIKCQNQDCNVYEYCKECQ